MITGIVIEGKKLGRTIGFPTANISYTLGGIEDGTYGLSGRIDGVEYYGIGVFLARESLFEAYFFDFSEDIYGEMITVEPLFKIRDNRKFSGLAELKDQIEKDREVMEEWIEEMNDRG